MKRILKLNWQYKLCERVNKKFYNGRNDEYKKYIVAEMKLIGP